MKKIQSFITSVLILLSISFYTCTKPAENIKDKHRQELQTIADEFQINLKNILGKELQINGVVSALSVCSDTAQMLTQNYSLSQQVDIKRVSLKNRNPINKPDAFEQKILEKFESQHLAGKLTDSTIYIDITRENNKEFIRFMKPIFVQPPCLLCHGDDISVAPEISVILNHKYPYDKARNYKTGDLRGAVSIKKILGGSN